MLAQLVGEGASTHFAQARCAALFDALDPTTHDRLDGLFVASK